VSQYYVKVGGNNGNSGLSDLLAWADPGKIGSVTLAADDIVSFKCGSAWFSSLNCGQSGTAGHRITFNSYSTGNKPIINCGTQVSTWTLDSGSIWKATLASAPMCDSVSINGVSGVKMASKAACVSEHQWFWASSVLYLYAPGDPDTQYTTPGVGVPAYSTAAYLEKNYLTFDGIQFEGGGYATMRNTGSGSHIVIKNCEVCNCDRGIELGTSAMTAYTDYDIHDNEIHDCATHGVVPLYNGSGIRICRNHIYNIAATTIGGQWPGGIKCFGQGLDAIEIYENHVHHCGLDAGASGYTCPGIWLDYVHPATTASIVRHNCVHDVREHGIFVEISSDSHVWGNLIYDCAWGTANGNAEFIPAGITVDCRETNLTEDNLIYNNTIYGGQVGIKCNSYSYQAGMSLSNNLFKNNIAVGYTVRALYTENAGANQTGGTGNVYWYNCFGPEAANFIRWHYVNKSTYDAWEATSGVVLDGGTTHSIEADPLLTNPTTHDFTLQAASPCINSGMNLGTTYKYGLMHDSVWPAAVVLGDQGAHGAGWEIGAYIYEAGGSAWIVGALAVGGS